MYAKILRKPQNSKWPAALSQKKTPLVPSDRLQTSKNRPDPEITVHVTTKNGKSFITSVEDEVPPEHREETANPASGSCHLSDGGKPQTVGAHGDKSFPDVAEVLGLKKGKRAVIPVLSSDGAKQISLFNWNVETAYYVRPIITYALSLHGCLAYDQIRFSDEYSPVFELID